MNNKLNIYLTLIAFLIIISFFSLKKEGYTAFDLEKKDAMEFALEKTDAMEFALEEKNLMQFALENSPQRSISYSELALNYWLGENGKKIDEIIGSLKEIEKKYKSDLNVGLIEVIDATFNDISFDISPMSENSTTQTISFKLPKGRKGPVGLKGFLGKKGENGDKGDRGKKGDDGLFMIPVPNNTSHSRLS